MLKFDVESVRKWPVSVRLPLDNGKYTTQKFTAHFKTLSISATTDLIEKARSEAEEQETIVNADALILREVFVGVEGVQVPGPSDPDDPGKEVWRDPDDDEVASVIEQMIDHAQYSQALMSAYRACRGRSDAKN